MAESEVPQWVKEKLDRRNMQVSERGRLIPGKERYGLTVEQEKMLESYTRQTKVTPEMVEEELRRIQRSSGKLV